MTGHTPLPWKAENGAGRGAWIMGADEGWSALVCGNNDETAIANKDFIVRACNSHYDILDCLKEARKHLDNADIDLAYIDEVIAKAEGRG